MEESYTKLKLIKRSWIYFHDYVSNPGAFTIMQRGVVFLVTRFRGSGGRSNEPEATSRSLGQWFYCESTRVDTRDGGKKPPSNRGFELGD